MSFDGKLIQIDTLLSKIYHKNTMPNITIPLRQSEKRQLMEAAIHYAIPAEELSRVVIAYAAKKLLSIPEESLEEYEHPKEIVAAYRKAVRAGKQGKLLTSLPKSIGRAS